jgi:hypothetical protein
MIFGSFQRVAKISIYVFNDKSFIVLFKKYQHKFRSFLYSLVNLQKVIYAIKSQFFNQELRYYCLFKFNPYLIMI